MINNHVLTSCNVYVTRWRWRGQTTSDTPGQSAKPTRRKIWWGSALLLPTTKPLPQGFHRLVLSYLSLVPIVTPGA